MGLKPQRNGPQAAQSLGLETPEGLARLLCPAWVTQAQIFVPLFLLNIDCLEASVGVFVYCQLSFSPASLALWKSSDYTACLPPTSSIMRYMLGLLSMIWRSEMMFRWLVFLYIFASVIACWNHCLYFRRTLTATGVPVSQWWTLAWLPCPIVLNTLYWE